MQPCYVFIPLCLIYTLFVFIQLEANLHRLALSAEWLKHVDSFVTMGSASHVVVTSLRASSRNGVGRKRGRLSDSENNHTSNAGGGLSMCWWRGGRLSRQLFSWKTVPSSLASKAARQGQKFLIFLVNIFAIELFKILLTE